MGRLISRVHGSLRERLCRLHFFSDTPTHTHTTLAVPRDPSPLHYAKQVIKHLSLLITAQSD